MVMPCVSGKRLTILYGFLAKLGNPDFFLIVPLLKLHADALEQCAAVFLRVLSQQTHRSPICLLRSQNALDGGAFSRAVGTQQSEHRTAFYREIQMIDHCFSVIGFGQSFYQNCLAHF